MGQSLGKMTGFEEFLGDNLAQLRWLFLGRAQSVCFCPNLPETGDFD